MLIFIISKELQAHIYCGWIKCVNFVLWFSSKHNDKFYQYIEIFIAFFKYKTVYIFFKYHCVMEPLTTFLFVLMVVTVHIPGLIQKVLYISFLKIRAATKSISKSTDIKKKYGVTGFYLKGTQCSILRQRVFFLLHVEI